MNRNELLATLREAYPIAQKRDSEYRTYESKLRSVRGRRITLREVLLGRRIMYCIPCFVLGFICSLLTAGVTSEETWESANIFVKLLSYLGVGTTFLAILVFIFAKQIHVRMPFYKKQMADLDAEEKQLEATYLPRFKESMAKSLSVFPELGSKYQNSHALEHMISYVENGRADTVKELIEAYETDCHRMRLEEKQAQILEDLQRQQEELDALSSQVNYLQYYR